MPRDWNPTGRWLSNLFGRLVTSRKSSPTSTSIDEEIGRQGRPARPNGSPYSPMNAGNQRQNGNTQIPYASGSSRGQSPASYASGSSLALHSTPASSAASLASRSTSPYTSHKAPGARKPLPQGSPNYVAQLPPLPRGAVFHHLIPRQRELLTVIVESGLEGRQQLHYIRRLLFQLPDSRGGPGTRHTELAAHTFSVALFKFDAAATSQLKEVLSQSSLAFDCHYFTVKATLRFQDGHWAVHLDDLRRTAAVPAITARLAKEAGYL